MNKYKQNTILFGTLLGSLLLLSGCGGLPKKDRITGAANPQMPPPASFNTPRRATNLPPPTARGINTPSAGKTLNSSKASITQANRLMRDGKKAEAAAMYYRLAFNYRSPQRERVMLQAAEISASTGDPLKTGRYLQSAARGQLTPLNQVRYRYIQALLALNNKQATQALSLLPPANGRLPKGLRDKIELVRRHASTQSRKLAQTNTNTARKPATAKTPTRRTLVASTPTVNYQNAVSSSALPTGRLNQPRKPITDALSAAAPQAQVQIPARQQPAAAPRYALPQNTSRIAVLLPGDGALAKVGNEIYQGIKDAQAIYGNDVLTKRYAVNKNNVLRRYQQAVEEGADIVIGPLNKAALSALTAQPELLQTPVLSLNYLSETGTLPHTLYQFGLSPEDEVTQIAELAMGRGQMRGVIMVPNSAWGRRMGNAFAKAYQQRNGEVLHVATYPNKADSSYLKRVQSLPGQAEGADMIFLAASPTQARLLHPLLKAQVGLLPVYATSHVFSGIMASNKDIDLDGIIYTEIPYILKKTDAGSLDQLKYPRLYALGMDSLMVARNLAPLVQRQTLGGQTGQIRMGEQGRMQRRMEFATFINGQPHSLRR